MFRMLRIIGLYRYIKRAEVFFNKGGIILKNNKLRVAWIIPNVFCYLMLVGLSIFVAINAEGLAEVDRLSIWVLSMFMLLIVSVFGSYRIWTWIKQGKL